MKNNDGSSKVKNMKAIQNRDILKGCVRAMLGFLTIALVTSCAKNFEGVALPLAVNNTALVLDTAAGSTHVMVYSTGNWSVNFKEKNDWAVLNKTEGSGNSDFVVTYTANMGAARSATILLKRDTLVKTIDINQLGR